VQVEPLDLPLDLVDPGRSVQARERRSPVADVAAQGLHVDIVHQRPAEPAGHWPVEFAPRPPAQGEHRRHPRFLVDEREAAVRRVEQEVRQRLRVAEPRLPDDPEEAALREPRDQGRHDLLAQAPLAVVVGAEGVEQPHRLALDMLGEQDEGARLAVPADAAGPRHPQAAAEPERHEPLEDLPADAGGPDRVLVPPVGEGRAGEQDLDRIADPVADEHLLDDRPVRSLDQPHERRPAAADHARIARRGRTRGRINPGAIAHERGRLRRGGWTRALRVWRMIAVNGGGIRRVPPGGRVQEAPQPGASRDRTLARRTPEDGSAGWPTRTG
jgi:hypothetical protein